MSTVNVPSAICTTTSTGSVDDLTFFEDSYLRPLQQLLPHGPAWTRNPAAELTKLLKACAYPFSRIARRALKLVDEAYPPLTYEMLGDWESAFSIIPATTDPATRRAAIVAAILGFSDPNAPSFISTAKTLGYNDAAIYTHKPYFVGEVVGKTIRNQAWRFRFDMVAHTRGATADAQLKAKIIRRQPDHTAFGLIDPYKNWTVEQAIPRPITTSTSLLCYGCYVPPYNGAPGGFVFGGQNGSNPNADIYSTSDGVTWNTVFTDTQSRTMFSVCTDGKGTLVVGTTNGFFYSVNGGVLTNVVVGGGTNFTCLEWNGVVFLAISLGGVQYTSPDGITWTSAGGAGDAYNRVQWNPTLGLWIIAGGTSGGGWLYTMPPTPVGSLTRKTIAGFAADGYTDVAVDLDGTMYCVYGTTFGTQQLVKVPPTFTGATNITPAGLTAVYCVAIDGYGRLVIVGYDGSSYGVWTSQDKVNFYRRATFTTAPTNPSIGSPKLYPRLIKGGDDNSLIFAVTNPDTTSATAKYHFATYRGYENLI